MKVVRPPGKTKEDNQGHSTQANELAASGTATSAFGDVADIVKDFGLGIS